MSKKFKTPLDITGFKEDCDKLIPLLEGLGYRKGTDSDMLYTMRGLGLVTNFGDTVGRLGYAVIGGYTRTKVEATNQDLALALAAMVDDDELYAGEWCKFIGDATLFMHGKLYRATKDGWGSKGLFIGDDGTHGGFTVSNGGNRTRFRKATVDEIQQHFNGQKRAQAEDTPPQDNTDVRKYPLTHGESSKTEEPIAYELSKTWPCGPQIGLKFIPSKITADAFIAETGTRWYDKSDILKYPEFFKPLFKPSSIKIPYEGGELEVMIKDHHAIVKGYKFNKHELDQLLSTKHIGLGPLEEASFKATAFTFGCKGQYKGITAESIQKVIDLL